jgi:cell division protein FtsI/penicillin-binding protein 2
VTRQADQRLRLILCLFGAAFAVVVGRAVYIQVVQADTLAAMARGQQNSTVVIPTQRGKILDRAGNVLAVDVGSKDVWVHPAQVQDPTQTASYIAQKLGYNLKHRKKLLAEVKLLRDRMTTSGPVSPTAQMRVLWQVDPAVADAIMAGHPPGVFLLDSVRRNYPSTRLASQLIGFVDANGSGAGGAGIEQQYNSVLAGRPGERLDVSGPGGVALDTITVRKAQPGRNVQLTIDRSIQQKVQAVLDATVRNTKARNATAIVLDPRNGSILGMATSPSYDDNTVHDLSTYQFNRDTHNMAVEYSYEPGSTF